MLWIDKLGKIKKNISTFGTYLGVTIFPRKLNHYFVN